MTCILSLFIPLGERTLGGDIAETHAVPDLNDVQFEEVVTESTSEIEQGVEDKNTQSSVGSLGDFKVICDLELLGSELDQCSRCCMPVRLSRCMTVKYHGLGAYLYRIRHAKSPKASKALFSK